MTTRNDASAPIALLLLAEGTLYFTFLFVMGPIPTLDRLLPLLAVVVLCAAVYWGFNWARWVMLLPIGFRLQRLVALTAAAWGLGRTGFAFFLTAIIVAELAGVFLLLDPYFRRASFPSPFSHKSASVSS